MKLLNLGLQILISMCITYAMMSASIQASLFTNPSAVLEVLACEVQK